MCADGDGDDDDELCSIRDAGLISPKAHLMTWFGGINEEAVGAFNIR